MLDGQVHCDNDPRDGGVRAGRVAYERAVGLSLSQASLFESEELLKPTHSVGKSILRSLGLHVLVEHARDREGSVRAGPI